MAPARRGLVACLLLALVALPAASASSLGVTPPELSLAGAQREETYVREVTLQNQFDTPSTFTVERDGETGAWARVEPADELVVPAFTDQVVRVVVEVPGDAPNGLHEGALRFVGAAKDRPDGSGFALRYAVAVPLRVELGGPQELRLRFADARAADVEAGTAPLVQVAAVNEGNVRADAAIAVRVLDATGAEVARAQDAARVRPGERVDVDVRLDAPLPLGTYTAIATPEGGEALPPVPFKVVPVGTLGKEGTLRYLQHATAAQAGLPVRVVGLFENTGAASIVRARLVGEAYLGERLVAVFSSEELAVPPGGVAELVAYFTSPEAGELRLVAHVVYDGFRSADNEGVLVAHADAPPRAGPPMALLAAGALAAVALLALLAPRLRKR